MNARAIIGLVVVAGALAALPACESSRGSTTLRPGVTAPAEPTAYDDVRVYDGVEPDETYEVLGTVTATSEARYEQRVGVAERKAMAELRTRAGEIGADAIVKVTREVTELPADVLETSVAGTFEDSRRDLLRPGGADTAASRPRWRVRMTAEAVRLKGASGTP